MSRSKKWQTKGGLVREDSDDELGYDDHPWQWIYADKNNQVSFNGSDPTENGQQDSGPPSKKRKASAMASSSATSATTGSTRKLQTIIAAQMGTFEVRAGDAVLLKSPEAGKDWAGLICAFSDTNEDGDEEMCAHIMWFCSREELESSGTGSGTSMTKRMRNLPDALSQETYITADFNMNPLTAINGKAIVMGVKDFMAKYPGGKSPRGKAAQAKFAKTIVCRRGVKQRNLRFTEEIEWKDVYQGVGDLLALMDWVKESTKGARRKADDVDYSVKADENAHQRTNDGGDGDVDIEPRTPKKKRKKTTTSTSTSVVTTPKSSVRSTKFVTPTSKRIRIKKPLEITPLGTRIFSPSHFDTASPYAQARSTLHVSAVPLSLPCRTAEFDTVYSHLYSAIADGSGSCIYISGTPGTGKTATVREVVGSLHGAVQADELDDFNFVEINGMKVTEPSQSYSLLWEALKGDRVSPANALSLLENEFSHPSPRRIPCVVLMDELDQLVTKSQSVMYNFFNWPSLRHSRLIVLAVANTMDLPERTLSNKISSRLGLTRITFPGYTHSQLMEIISSRLEGVQGLVDADAVQFAARKVAAVSGDARRALDICRRAVEIAEQQAKSRNAITTTKDANLLEDTNNNNNEEEEEEDELMGVTTPSKTGRNNSKNKSSPTKKSTTQIPSSPPPSSQQQQQPHVTIATIKAAINEATSNPTSQHLRSLSLSSKLFLAALLARTRRTGINESTMGDILIEAKRIADIDERSVMKDFLLMSKGYKNELPRVLALGGAAMDLVEAGILAVDSRSRGERAGKVRLRVGEEVVVSAMIGDEDAKGMGFTV